jgi:hypothetical protein
MSEGQKEEPCGRQVLKQREGERGEMERLAGGTCSLWASCVRL